MYKKCQQSRENISLPLHILFHQFPQIQLVSEKAVIYLIFVQNRKIY